MPRVTRKVALVTGGASGIGRATALALAADGAFVFSRDVDTAGCLKVCASIADANGQSSFLHPDVTEQADWTAAIEATRRLGGRLDILVNNAGICIMKPRSALAPDDWRRLMSMKLAGVYLGTRAALTLLAENDGGSIINMSSAAGLMATPTMAAYCAFTARVIVFSSAMALECAQLGLKFRVNSICPGGVATPLWVKLTNNGVLPEQGVTDAEMHKKRGWTEAITPLSSPAKPRMPPSAWSIWRPTTHGSSPGPSWSSMAATRPVKSRMPFEMRRRYGGREQAAWRSKAKSFGGRLQ